jgi:hypothetical protein
LFGINKVDVFRGAYQLPNAQKIASLDTPTSKLILNGINIEKPRSNFGFNLTDSSYAMVKWKLTGPEGSSYMSYIDGQKFVLNNSLNKLFKLNDSGIEVVSKHQSSKQNFDLPDDFPRFSWVSGVAFDSKRNIVTVASYGGEGFLYRFDTNKNKWIDYVSLNNQDILYLSYDQFLDRYVGWTTDGELTFLSATGTLLFGENVKDRIQGFGRLYDGGNSSVPTLVVRPRGNDIALIYINCQHVIRVWNYQISTHSSQLTYKDTANMDVSNHLKRANIGSCR